MQFKIIKISAWPYRLLGADADTNISADIYTNLERKKEKHNCNDSQYVVTASHSKLDILQFNLDLIINN